jgi:hypothetical protein
MPVPSIRVNPLNLALTEPNCRSFIPPDSARGKTNPGPILIHSHNPHPKQPSSNFAGPPAATRYFTTGFCGGIVFGSYGRLSIV